MGWSGTHRRTAVFVGMAVAATVALSACGADEELADPVAGPTTSVSPSPSPTATGTVKPPPTGAVTEAPVPAVLEFSGRTVDGATFRGSSVAGRPVVLWFWAPWCAVCRSQAPQVESLAAEYGDDLAVIGIGSLDSGSAIAGFADDVRGPVHLSDPDGALWKRFRISQQSSFVVLDASGKEVLRTGYNDDDALAATVEEIVG